MFGSNQALGAVARIKQCILYTSVQLRILHIATDLRLNGRVFFTSF